MRIVFDTSALLSLAAGGILEVIVNHIECCIPERVEEELLGLSRNRGYEGGLAKEVHSFVNREIKVIKTGYAIDGETACVLLANDSDVDFLVTDDIASLKRIKQCKKEILFSVHMIQALFIKGKISKGFAKQTIERMRVKRDWKDNALSDAARALFE